MTLDRRSVSESTAARLSLYVRSLAVLETEGVRHVSSHAFARRFDLNSAQIRKDLATFGEFGVRGVGYEVSLLRKHLISILGLDQTRSVAIVGAGRLGTALADYPGFRSG
ncbi:MAG: redox-sensing transcriptional repressor Rex, partial [Acidobacteriota bacterium]|nr:redox-sensing transcriptional repressor Rex [Acidobacteriota bacterium]